MRDEFENKENAEKPRKKLRQKHNELEVGKSWSTRICSVHLSLMQSSISLPPLGVSLKTKTKKKRATKRVKGKTKGQGQLMKCFFRSI